MDCEKQKRYVCENLMLWKKVSLRVLADVWFYLHLLFVTLWWKYINRKWAWLILNVTYVMENRQQELWPHMHKVSHLDENTNNTNTDDLVRRWCHKQEAKWF